MPFERAKQAYLKSLTNPYEADCLMSERYSFTSVLSRFVPVAEHGTFHRLQYETGLIIAGSFVLQYLEGRHFDFSDMDLYVVHRNRFPIIRWIIELGYVYFPSASHSAQTLDAAIGSMDPTIDPNDEDRKRMDGAYKSAASVLTFRHPDSEEVIQLVTTHWNPLEMVLNFHSTCVMNVITHDYAISLFPDLTFLDRVSLFNNPISEEQRQLAKTKYIPRGWNFIEYIDFAIEDDPTHSLYPGHRAFGDSKCWKVQLYPKKTNNPIGDINLNTWLQEYDGLKPTFSYSLHLVETFDRHYLTANATTAAMLHRLQVNLGGWLEMTTDNINRSVSNRDDVNME